MVSNNQEMMLIGSKINNITIDSFIAKGGMGSVYRGVHANLDRYFAIKFFEAPFTNPQTAELFRNEALLLSKVHDSHVVKVYDFGEHEGMLYIVMEYIEGDTLQEYLQKRMSVPLAQTLSIAQHITQGLIAVHRQGITHRDIKPSNLLIDTTGRVVITDFGIANSSAQAILPDELVKGSPGYISPEQARGEVTDGRSDIYSLGIIMYQMLVGNKAYSHKDGAIQTIVQQLQQDIPNLKLRLPDIPVELLSLIQKMTSRTIAMRPNTIEEVAQVLQSIVQKMRDHSSATTTIVPQTAIVQAQAKVATVHPTCTILQEALSQFVGPLAPHILKQVLTRLEYASNSCDSSQLDILFEAVEKKVDRKYRNEFNALVLKKITESVNTGS